MPSPRFKRVEGGDVVNRSDIGITKNIEAPNMTTSPTTISPSGNLPDISNIIESAVERGSERAAERALVRYKEANKDSELPDVSEKFVKQLQSTVTVFNSLKEFVQNPLQKAIETKVGDVAAEIVGAQFNPRPQEPAKKDFLDIIFNSKFGENLGAGLGQRAPELVDTIQRGFGPKKTEEWIDRMIPNQKQLGDGVPGGSGVVGTGGGGSKPMGADKATIDALLALDPNNPEHVVEYAKLQKVSDVRVARKMLMIQQDEFISQKKGYPYSANVGDDGSIQNNPIQNNPIQDKVIVPPVRQPQPPPYDDYASASLRTQQYPERPPVPPIPYVPNVAVPNVAAPVETTNHVENNNNQIDVTKLGDFLDKADKVLLDVSTRVGNIENTIISMKAEINEIKQVQIIVPEMPMTGMTGLNMTDQNMIENMIETPSVIESSSPETDAKPKEITPDKTKEKDKSKIMTLEEKRKVK